jgi:hypothetical protein
MTDDWINLLITDLPMAKRLVDEWDRSGRADRAWHRPGDVQDLADFLPFFLPMLGNFFFTAALTFFCSSLVPCWATRASALRAWALSGIGYLRLPGRANDFLLSFLRFFDPHQHQACPPAKSPPL